jgi:hypothetical protein
MAIPIVFSPVKKQDFSLIPTRVNKKFFLDSAEFESTESGYFLRKAVHSNKPTPIGASQASNDPTNSIDNTYQHAIWNQIDHRFYRFAYDRYATLEHSNPRYTYKNLNVSASVISIPYLDYGERIKAGSVEISGSSVLLSDDQNGNLYDTSIFTGSFTNRDSIIGYWGFNDVFRKFRYFSGTIKNGDISYVSRIFTPDENSFVKNVTFDGGVKINSVNTGMEAQLSGQSYILTRHRDEFNFTKNENFSIAFWIKCPLSQSNNSASTNTVIGKNGVVHKIVYGNEQKYNQNDVLYYTNTYSSSLENESINVYPFLFDLHNNTSATPGRVEFKRSDGINTLSISTTGSIAGIDHQHIAVCKNGSLISLYLNGILHSSAIDRTDNPINKNSIMFGAQDLNYTKGFSGSLDEIRFYDYALTQAEILTLCNNTNQSLYQTAVVGNIFYRSGEIVISPFDKKYLNVFDNNFFINYRGTHTVYSYECLVRIKKGSFNLTHNPTARVSYKSDLLIPDMTGSLLTPYFTSIGLYNDKGELMAIAKMGQPIQTRSDVDLNVLIKWDV